MLTQEGASLVPNDAKRTLNYLLFFFFFLVNYLPGKPANKISWATCIQLFFFYFSLFFFFYYRMNLRKDSDSPPSLLPRSCNRGSSN